MRSKDGAGKLALAERSSTCRRDHTVTREPPAAQVLGKLERACAARAALELALAERGRGGRAALEDALEAARSVRGCLFATETGSIASPLLGQSVWYPVSWMSLPGVRQSYKGSGLDVSCVL